MPKFFHLSKNMSTKLKGKTKSSKKMRLSIQTLNLTILGLIVFASVSYLVQVNALVTQGYQIKDLESQISQLEESARSLKLESLELGSMDKVRGKISQLNMVAAGPAEYLSGAPLVAVAR